MTYGAFLVIIMFVEFMNGSLIGGDAYDYFVGKPSQNRGPERERAFCIDKESFLKKRRFYAQ